MKTVANQSGNQRFLLPLDDYEQEELDTTDDVWRPCPGYPGYDASWTGFVRSWLVPNHGRFGFHYEEVNRVPVKRGGKVLTRTRGHLVANAYLVQPEPAWQLQYIDGNNRNASVQNLTWQVRMDRIQSSEGYEKYLRSKKERCVHGHPLVPGMYRLVGDSRMCLICARAHSSMHSHRRRLRTKGLDWSHVTLEYTLKRRGDWVDPTSYA